MFYDSYDFWWWPFVFILIAGAVPTAIWRWAGVFLVGNMDETSEWLVFIRCIATGLVAAVIAQFVFNPTGTLAELPLWLRLGAAFGGFGIFLVTGRHVFVGVLMAEVLLLSGMWLVM
jgi:hypothetical protein